MKMIKKMMSQPNINIQECVKIKNRTASTANTATTTNTRIFYNTEIFYNWFISFLVNFSTIDLFLF